MNIDSRIEVDSPSWLPAAREALIAVLKALPPCRCLGPMVTISDYGNGAIMDVSYDHTLPESDIRLMDEVVSLLGWRGWSYTETGIAFKPTSVRLAKRNRIAGESRDPTPQEVSDLRSFVRRIVKTSVRSHWARVGGTTVTIDKPLDGGTGEQYTKIADYLIRNGWVSLITGDTQHLEKQMEYAKRYDAFYTIALMKKAV